MTTYRDAVQQTANRLGYGSYTTQIDAIVREFERASTDAVISRMIIAYGASPQVADRAVSQVRQIVAESTPASAETTDTTEAGGFDRASAAATIRAFIQNGQPHVGDRGASPEDVDALLILAGLEDEPEPEVEPMADTEEPGLLQRLASWARGQGFRG